MARTPSQQTPPSTGAENPAPEATPAVLPLKVADGQAVIYGNAQLAPADSFFLPVSAAERKECLDLNIAVEPEAHELDAAVAATSPTEDEF